MFVDIHANAVMKVDIDAAEAFRILCKSLRMDFVLDEDTDYFIKKHEWEENGVYKLKNGCDHKVDDRGDLFVALRNVAVNMFPDVHFRSAEYIWNNSREEPQ